MWCQKKKKKLRKDEATNKKKKGIPSKSNHIKEKSTETIQLKWAALDIGFPGLWNQSHIAFSIINEWHSTNIANKLLIKRRRHHFNRTLHRMSSYKRYTCNNENLKPLISTISSDSTKLAVSPSRLAPLLHIRVPGMPISSSLSTFKWIFQQYYKLNPT